VISYVDELVVEPVTAAKGPSVIVQIVSSGVQSSRHLYASNYNESMAWHREHPRESWLAFTALVGAGLTLPLAPSAWHGPQASAVLAVAAIARLAGQRWALAVIVLAELCLLATVLPRAVYESALLQRGIALATIVVIIPGLLAIPRAAIVLAGMTGHARPEQMRRYTHIGLLAVGLVAVLVPLL